MPTALAFTLVQVADENLLTRPDGRAGSQAEGGVVVQKTHLRVGLAAVVT